MVETPPDIADFCNLAIYQAIAPAVPYVFGGIWLKGGSHAPGLDCSGLPYAVSLRLGQSIARTSEAQFATLPEVQQGELRQGDTIFYNVPGDTQPQPAHMAIYWTPELVLQAPHTGLNVELSAPLPYQIMGYRRLPFPDRPTAPPAPPAPPQGVEAMYAFQNAQGQTVIVGTQQSTGHTVVVTSGADQHVEGGWSLADVTGEIEKAYPGTVVVVE